LNLGFLGTGHITAAMVTGLGLSEHRIWVSPRNAETAADLARRFSSVTVAASNQDVIDRSDVVVLALPPRTAPEILAGLTFRADTQVISVISGLSIARIPSAQVTRAVPVPSVADRAGPTVIYPPNRIAADVFDSLGTTIQVDSEEEFEAFCAVTATIASQLAFLDSIASWLMRHGAPENDARDYIRAMMSGAINGDAGAEAHATPGGINERLLQHLRRHNVFERVTEGLDLVLNR